jgi:hypothetical protein
MAAISADWRSGVVAGDRGSPGAGAAHHAAVRTGCQRVGQEPRKRRHRHERRRPVRVAGRCSGRCGGKPPEIREQPRLALADRATPVQKDPGIVRVAAAQLDPNLVHSAPVRCLVAEGDLVAAGKIEQPGHERGRRGPTVHDRGGRRGHPLGRCRQQDRRVVEVRGVTAGQQPSVQHPADHHDEGHDATDDRLHGHLPAGTIRRTAGGRSPNHSGGGSEPEACHQPLATVAGHVASPHPWRPTEGHQLKAAQFRVHMRRGDARAGPGMCIPCAS